MKKTMRYIYPIISLMIIILVLGGFNQFDGIYMFAHSSGATVITKFALMIIAGIAIGLEHWLSPVERRISLVIERLLLAVFIFTIVFSNLNWFSGTSEWILVMIGGYEAATTIACFTKK